MAGRPLQAGGEEMMVALVRFFSLHPRAGAPRWLAWFALTLGIFWLGAYALSVAEGAALVAVYALLGVAAAKLATESVRRLHDCGQSGWLGLAVALGIVALLVTALLRWLAHGTDPLFWVALGLAVAATAALLLRPGASGANAYGDPPAGFATGDAGDGKAGVLLATLFLVAGIGAGVAVLAWQAGREREREARTRHLERYVTPPDLFPGMDEAPANGEGDALANENAATSDRIDALLNEEDAR